MLNHTSTEYGGENMFLLCCVMCLSFVSAADYEYFLQMQTEYPEQNVSIPVGATVTLVCHSKYSQGRVEWYKNFKYAVELDNTNGECKLGNKHYMSISSGPHVCRGGNYSIKFSSIRNDDEGLWKCYIPSSRAYSQPLHITVKASNVATSVTDTPDVSTRKPETNAGVTDDSEKTKDNLSPLLSGAIGGTVSLMVIVTILVVLARKRKKLQRGTTRTEYHDSGEVIGQRGGNADLEDGLGGEYAQISDAAGVKTKKSDSVCRKYSDNDEHDTVPDVYSVVQKPAKSEATAPDVYSVVQKPLKSRPPSSAKDDENPGPDVYSVVQKPVNQDHSSDTEVTDVYSVVQKPAKM